MTGKVIHRSTPTIVAPENATEIGTTPTAAAAITDRDAFRDNFERSRREWNAIHAAFDEREGTQRSMYRHFYTLSTLGGTQPYDAMKFAIAKEKCAPGSRGPDAWDRFERLWELCALGGMAPSNAEAFVHAAETGRASRPAEERSRFDRLMRFAAISGKSGADAEAFIDAVDRGLVDAESLMSGFDEHERDLAGPDNWPRAGGQYERIGAYARSLRR